MTTVEIDPLPFSEQVSGFVGRALRYWFSSWLSVQSGVGSGTRSTSSDDDFGTGLFLGIAWVIVPMQRSHLHLGLDASLAMSAPENVYNLEVVLGWQLR